MVHGLNVTSGAAGERLYTYTFGKAAIDVVGSQVGAAFGD
jgi:hypothetical protein